MQPCWPAGRALPNRRVARVTELAWTEPLTASERRADREAFLRDQPPVFTAVAPGWALVLPRDEVVHCRCRPAGRRGPLLGPWCSRAPSKPRLMSSGRSRLVVTVSISRLATGQPWVSVSFRHPAQSR